MHMSGDNCFALTRGGAAASSASSQHRKPATSCPENSRGSRSLSPRLRPGTKGVGYEKKKNYGFTVVLTAATLSVKECDALYEAGCDDGTIVTRKGKTFIIFDRKAESLEQAIRSATGDVRAAGFDVKRVEMPALV